MLKKDGSVSWTKSELISRKIRIRILNFVHVFPPASVPLRRTKQKFFLYIFNYAHPKKFLIRKRKCFCFVFLLIREKRKRSILNRKRAKIPSPRPPSFLPFCFSGFARFFCGAFIIIVALASPLPCAGNGELPERLPNFIK